MTTTLEGLPLGFCQPARRAEARKLGLGAKSAFIHRLAHVHLFQHAADFKPLTQGEGRMEGMIPESRISYPFCL